MNSDAVFEQLKKFENHAQLASWLAGWISAKVPTQLFGTETSI